jgi:hypothetical protein
MHELRVAERPVLANANGTHRPADLGNTLNDKTSQCVRTVAPEHLEVESGQDAQMDTRPILICGCGLVFLAVTCSGQTNSTVEAGPQFFLPPIHLRLEQEPEAVKPASKVELSLKPLSQTPQITSSSLEVSWSDGSEFHSSVIRPGEFYLTQAEPLPHGAVARTLDRIFSPEIVHVGKIPVSASIVTAIKRKNPLCLLNPIFFQISF